MTTMTLTPREQFVQLSRGAVTLQTKDELLSKLKKGKPLRIKLGFDPSAPDIHSRQPIGTDPAKWREWINKGGEEKDPGK